MKPENDCSAFPVIPPENAAGYPFPELGMSLRDYFAANASQAIISTGKTFKSVKAISEAAYTVADAMLSEREK